MKNRMNTLRKYLRLWLMFAGNELQQQFSTKVSAVLFFLGKTFRFLAFLAVLIVLRNNTKSLAGYNFQEIILFFFTFNFIDLLSQIFFRGVYMFSGKVRTGEFDYYLAKPIHPLFRSLASNPDFNDVLMFIPLLLFFMWYVAHAGFVISPNQVALYIFLIVNGLLIAMSFHILVICVGIVTTEVDNAIMMYRGLSEIGRFPIEMYREPFRWIVTFIIPIGIMMSVPAKTLIGRFNTQLLFVSFLVGLISIVTSLILWKFSLRKYTSASS